MRLIPFRTRRFLCGHCLIYLLGLVIGLYVLRYIQGDENKHLLGDIMRNFVPGNSQQKSERSKHKEEQLLLNLVDHHYLTSTVKSDYDKEDISGDENTSDYNTVDSIYPIYSHNYMSSFDRFQVGNAKLRFLENFKSPCWLERNNDSFPYRINNMLTAPKFTKQNCFREGLQKSKPLFVTLPGLEQPYRLRCLPYFMLLGVAKSGTSDFQYRLVKSNYVFKSFSKELYWWNQFRFIANATLSDYSDLLDFGLKDLIKLQQKDSPCWPGIIGEMTSITLSDVSYWREDPRNLGLKEPKFLTPHDVFGVLPNLKLIVLLRNPTARLYSHYNMWAVGKHLPKTPQDFHMRVVNSIKWWNNCNEILPLRGCLYGSPTEMAEVEHMLSSWWPLSANHSGELRTGMYYYFVKDWLSVFPKENFLFIRSEDYKRDKVKIMADIVFPFLDIPQPNEKEIEDIQKMNDTFQQQYQPILPETKNMLDEFYQPINDKLAKLLDDKKWSWKHEQ